MRGKKEGLFDISFFVNILLMYFRVSFYIRSWCAPTARQQNSIGFAAQHKGDRYENL
jgi:hypothetical protein